MYTIASISEIITCKRAHIFNDAQKILELVYDTRKISMAQEGLFFALKNGRDGHLFVADAYQKGIRSFVLADLNFSVSSFPEANFMWVEDTLKAIQQLAAYHRRQFTIPVIGITGSNGKTIVKEWLYQLLEPDYVHQLYKSPKSYNSQLGVALSLWNIQADHKFALIEAGISRVGEMLSLQQMIQPTIGILTNLGTAHMEGFASKTEKLAEKWKLFSEVDRIIFPSAYVPDAGSITNGFSWGLRSGDQLLIKDKSQDGNWTVIVADYLDAEVTFAIPLLDNASIENACSCIAVMLYLGYPQVVIQERVKSLRPLEMRLELKKGKNNCSIIDDTYSNDLASLQIALDFLNQQNQHQHRSLILSGFIGLEWTERVKSKIVQLLNDQALYKVILVGHHLAEIQEAIQSNVYFYKDTADLIADFGNLTFVDETVLIKGARRFHLEDISHLLVEKSHETVLEINLKSMEHNLVKYRSLLKKDVKMMAMVKAFSYGAGGFEVANLLQFNKIDYLTVAFVDEGVELRAAGIKLPVMVLSPHEGAFADMVRYRLEPEIYSLRILQSFVTYLTEQQIDQYPVHIKLDTGMHRLGFMEDEIAELSEALQHTSRVKVVSVFSHLVAAGDPLMKEFTVCQISAYKRIASVLEKDLGYGFLKHICNTSGIVHYPDAQLDMVRLGIGLYGIDMTPNRLHLEQVSTLKTTITQIKSLVKGETVGYDRKGVLDRDSKIATVKIGYADGYDRRLGNAVGQMMINRKLVNTVGNICMDMCMLDITDVEAREGDEVLVFPNLEQTAKSIGAIPYELLVGISARVKRVYYYE